jgi:hypothetical protein
MRVEAEGLGVDGDGRTGIPTVGKIVRIEAVGHRRIRR